MKYTSSKCSRSGGGRGSKTGNEIRIYSKICKIFSQILILNLIDL